MLVSPGTYTVTLEVDGRSQSQDLTILKDPNSEGSLADIRAQLEALSEVREDYDVVAQMVNRIEWVRRQMYDLNRVLEDRGDASDILASAAELDERLIAAEGNLVRLMTTGTGQDGVRWAPKLAEELRYLAGGLSGSDFQPTDQHIQVKGFLNEEVDQYRAEVEQLLRSDVAEFNRMLQERNMLPVITGNP